MASAGTLLSDLDDGSGGGDGDLVQKILADMNIPSGNDNRGGGMPPPPPPMPQQAPPGYDQMPSSMQGMTMDSRVPMSHMIGNEHPTHADFAAAMAGVSSSRHDIAAMASPVGQPMPGVMPTRYEAPSKNLYGTVLQEIKVPLVVAFLFLLFSLPPIRILIAHYAPSLIRPTGDYHMTGLLAVSVLVGSSFWLLQRVIAPLLSL
jgi:hypothetical protein